jgi:DUF4097 and DUF4098 domain-containing protein YvlB
MKTLILVLLVSVFVCTVLLAQEKIDKTLKAPADGAVEISNVSGSVVVTGWDRNEVHVKGTLGEGTDGLEFTSSGNLTVIEVKHPKHARHVEESHLHIRLPDKSSVEVQAVSASIEVSKVNGELELQSVSGRVSVEGEPEAIEAQSVSGAVDISVSSQDVEVETVSGSIDLEGVKRRVKAASVSGSIHVTGGNLKEAEFESVSGRIRYEGGLEKSGRLNATNFSGMVELYLPSSLSAKFDVTTFSGNIDNEFGGETVRKHKYSPGSELSFTSGSGDARVSAESFSGSVRLLKK